MLTSLRRCERQRGSAYVETGLNDPSDRREGFAGARTSLSEVVQRTLNGASSFTPVAGGSADLTWTVEGPIAATSAVPRSSASAGSASALLGHRHPGRWCRPASMARTGSCPCRRRGPRPSSGGWFVSTTTRSCPLTKSPVARRARRVRHRRRTSPYCRCLVELLHSSPDVGRVRRPGATCPPRETDGMLETEPPLTLRRRRRRRQQVLADDWSSHVDGVEVYPSARSTSPS